MSQPNPDSSTRRPSCPRCARPLRTCLCAWVRPVAQCSDVLLLQHPQEQHQAKGSATLLALSLSRCRVVVGETFAPAELATLLYGRPGSAEDQRQPVLLYPADALLQTPKVLPEPAQVQPPELLPERLRLVLLDATWRKSRKLLHCNPLLRALPRLSLAAPPPSRYAALRKAQQPEQRSTLEAACLALSQIEPELAGPQGACSALLDAFEDWAATWGRGQGQSRAGRGSSELSLIPE